MAGMGMMPAFVYVLECADGTFYTGWTNNVEKRLAAHNLGTGARYTRGRLPVKLAYMEETNDKASAQSREAAIKKLSREQKAEMIGSGKRGE